MIYFILCLRNLSSSRKKHIKIFLYTSIILCEILRSYAYIFQRWRNRCVNYNGCKPTFQAFPVHCNTKFSKNKIRQTPYPLKNPQLNPWKNRKQSPEVFYIKKVFLKFRKIHRKTPGPESLAWRMMINIS